MKQQSGRRHHRAISKCSAARLPESPLTGCPPVPPSLPVRVPPQWRKPICPGRAVDVECAIESELARVSCGEPAGIGMDWWQAYLQGCGHSRLVSQCPRLLFGCVTILLYELCAPFGAHSYLWLDCGTAAHLHVNRSAVERERGSG